MQTFFSGENRWKHSRWDESIILSDSALSMWPLMTILRFTISSPFIIFWWKQMGKWPISSILIFYEIFGISHFPAKRACFPSQNELQKPGTFVTQYNFARTQKRYAKYKSNTLYFAYIENLKWLLSNKWEKKQWKYRVDTHATQMQEETEREMKAEKCEKRKRIGKLWREEMQKAESVPWFFFFLFS